MCNGAAICDADVSDEFSSELRTTAKGRVETEVSRPLRPDHVPRDSDHLHHERRRSPHIIQSHDLSGPNRRNKKPDGYAPGADERHRYLSVVDGLPSSSRVARQLRTTASRKGNRRYRRESHATALRVKPLTLSPILVFEAWPASFTPSPPRRVMSRAALDRPMVQNALYLSLLVGETCCSRDSGLLQLTPRPSNSGWTYSPKMTSDIVRKTISRSSTKEALRTYQTSSAALPAVEIARPPMTCAQPVKPGLHEKASRNRRPAGRPATVAANRRTTSRHRGY